MNKTDTLYPKLEPSKQKPDDAAKLLSRLPHTARAQQVDDYLAGRWLGPADSGGIPYWTGPLPAVGNVNREEIIQQLKVGIRADNIFFEVVRRMADAPEGLEDWRLSGGPTGAEDDLSAWWDAAGLDACIYAALIALVAHGRTVCRPVLSRRAVDEEGRLKRFDTLAEALAHISWQSPAYPQQFSSVKVQQAGVLHDEETLERMSVLTYRVNNAPALEASWLLPNGNTAFRIADGDRDSISEHNLGGRLWLCEAQLPYRMGTESMLGCVSGYVVASTILDKNTHYAAWVERWSVGVEPPLIWYDKDGRRLTRGGDPDKGDYFEVGEVTVSPKAHTFFQPSREEVVTEETDTMGNVKITTDVRTATPQMGRWEPVSPEAIMASLQHWQDAVRREARQAFIGMAANATASGRSREYAAADYRKAANQLTKSAAGLVRDVLETSLAIAGLMLNDDAATACRNARVTVNAQPRAFQSTVEERAAALAEFQAGVIDLETAIKATGLVQDPEMMLKKLKSAHDKMSNEGYSVPTSDSEESGTDNIQDS